uniref:MPN domain-containing protein n=1 Tax=Meloidogyne hapla TaxID=6305 RepID=A0A1I8BYU1_MELHA
MVPLPGHGTDNKEAEKLKVSHCLSSVQANLPVNKVIVHPLVLLSVVDHFNRISKTQRVSRVVGVLLGSMGSDKTIDTSNSFAVPYDEDAEDSNVFFLDADYLEDMFGMFYKVAAREKIVGWYHTGPKLCKNDILINEVIKRFVPNPILVIIQASQASHEQMNLGLPTDAYVEVQEVHDDGSPPIKTFEHVPCEIGAEEAEEVGVEHLLRDIKNSTAGTLSQRITNQFLGLVGFQHQLEKMSLYAKRVVNKELPEILNLLPDVLSPDFVDAHNSMSNDQAMRIYLGNLARTVIALDDLIDNKLVLQRAEEKSLNEKKSDTEEKTKSEKSDEVKSEKV